MVLTLYGSRLLILCDEMAEKVGRIFVADKHSERSRTATVVAVGDEVKNYQVGDKVLLSWYTGVHLHLIDKELFGIPVDEDKHRLVMEGEILGKLTE
jgi:co-chaperonin GroES (HSP10)